MNKKFKIALISIAVLVVTLVTVGTCAALLPKANMLPSDYDMGVTYEQAAKEDKPILAVFYVDWCTYCRHFMPKLDKVRNINKDNFNVVLVNVEDPKNEKLAKDYKIGGYPTVYIIDTKYDNRVHIDSPYLESVSSLNKEVSRYYNFRKLVKGESCK